LKTETLNTTNLLVDKVKQGDKEAFAALYDNYTDALFGVVSKIVRSDEIAEDVMQDSFVKIWKNIHSFNPEKGTIFTWMLNVSRNTAIDKLRKLRKTDNVEIQVLDYSVGVPHSHSTTKTDHIGLRELVDKLKPDQKLMVEYIYFNGYTQQEVSDELGIPLGTVKTRVRTAVIELRKVFTNLILAFWI
jgi:RNA polymerase sigma-70 factor (ECF subfamily)